MKKLILLVFSFLMVGFVSAEIILPKVITNNMVLQREKTVAIWGKADVNEKVTVKFEGQIKTVVADSSGNWEVKLNPMSASAVPRKMIISGSYNYTRQYISW